MIDDFLTPDKKEIQLVVFQLSGEEYAVPIMCIQEIIMLQPFTRIPKAPSFVEGVINLRGHIIPIIDGAERFQLNLDKSHRTDQSRIIIMGSNNETIGLVVDSVSEVLCLNIDDIEPPPIDMGENSEILWGVGKYQNRLLILLNPEEFLNITETLDLRKFAKVAEIINTVKETVDPQETKQKSKTEF